MARTASAAVKPAPLNLCYLFVFWVITLDIFANTALGIITYNSQALIDIGLSTHFIRSPSDVWARSLPAEILRSAAQQPRRRSRGKRGGVKHALRARVHKPPLPSIMVANVQSLNDEKVDDLRLRCAFERDIRNCNIFLFTETWLNPSKADHSIKPMENLSVYRSDRTFEESKKEIGGGVAVMVNEGWCHSGNITVLRRFCSPEVEILAIKCRPHYLPRKFTSVVIVAVYIPPQACTKTALTVLHDALNSYQASDPMAALAVAGDFNKANLKKVMPNLYQHIDCATRGSRTLDHCYTPFKGGYKAQSLAPVGKRDHAAVFLWPSYVNKLRREPPMTRQVRRWTDQSEDSMRVALHEALWGTFKNCTVDINTDINVLTENVVNIISTTTDMHVPKVTVKVFENQKPWINNNTRNALKQRTAAYKLGLETGNMDDYKAALYNVRKVVKDAKREYGEKMESKFQQGDLRSVWQGLKIMTDYKRPPPSSGGASKELVDNLNTFFARFDTCQGAIAPGRESDGVGGSGGPLVLSEHDVRRTLKLVNARKAEGPDEIAGRVLKVCADQLAPVFTAIFNLSLAQSIIPICFKRSTIIPIPKKPRPACHNDYRPVALTSVVMKCFEKLVKAHICSSLPNTLDPLQFAYRPNRSTEDAITHILHSVLSHLDKSKGKVLNYVRLLFVDYSSAFNTILPSTLIKKLRSLGLNDALCRWILDFLTERPQVVKAGRHTSSPLTLNTGAPQGCVLSPLLYSLYTHDCAAIADSNTIIKFADTVVVGLFRNNDETAYLEEVRCLTQWCLKNNLHLNASKTKEMLVDFGRTQKREYTPVSINGTPVERVDTFKYLGVQITDDLTSSTHLDTVGKKARQRLYHLRRLKKFRASKPVLRSFYTCTIESMLTGNITAWYGNTTIQDRKALQRVVHSAERTIGGKLPNLADIYTKRCKGKTSSILKDPSHPGYGLFSLLRSGNRYRSLAAKTERLRKSFYPQAVRYLNGTD